MADAKVLGSTKKVKLDADVFGAEFNGPLVHEVVVAELAARRRALRLTLTV
jgi:large subunit ribosomal protein L4